MRQRSSGYYYLTMPAPSKSHMDGHTQLKIRNSGQKEASAGLCWDEGAPGFCACAHSTAVKGT